MSAIRACWLALMFAGAILAQDGATSTHAAQSQPNQPSASTSSPLYRGWLSELLDHDLPAARDAYEEAAIRGGATSHEQQILALGRLLELDSMLGQTERSNDRREKLRALGAQFGPAVPLENPAARGLEELRNELAREPNGGDQDQRLNLLRTRLRTALEKYSPRTLVTRLLQQRGILLRGPQQNYVQYLRQQIKQAESKHDTEFAARLQKEYDNLLSELQRPFWRREHARSYAIEVVRLRLDGKAAIAERAEENLRSLVLRQPGRLPPRPALDEPRGLLAMQNGLDRFLRNEPDLPQPERATLARCQTRVKELVAAGKNAEARELMRPLLMLR